MTTCCCPLSQDGCSTVMQFDAIFKYNNVSGNAQQIPDTNATADGIVGDILPTAFYYLPMVDDGTSKFRYWTRFIVAVPDMQGSREQNVWSRFQQIQCAGPDMKPPCTLATAPMYWDTYWFATYCELQYKCHFSRFLQLFWAHNTVGDT